MIDRIKSVLSPLTGINYNTPDLPLSVFDYHGFLTKLCTDEILKLGYGATNVKHNDFGDIDITEDESFYKIDIKIQDVTKVYSFPNLISINKAKDILTKPNNHIIYIFVEYEYKDEHTKITRISIKNIESLDWAYLYIQNLGKGQLQIKNISKEEFIFKNDVTRSQWFNQLKEKSIEYYDNLILKVVGYKSEWENNE